jgi:membrane protein
MNSRPKLTTASFIDLLRSTAIAFGEDRVGRHAAALAYFTVFSLSPLFVVIISIAALYFRGPAQAVGAITGQIQETVGPTAAKAIEEMIQTANGHGGDAAKPIWATVVAFGVALFGASGLFGALQDSLNAIWGVMPKPDLGYMGLLRTRFISFAMVLGVGFLLLVSLVASTALSALSHMMSGALGDSVYVAWTINFLLGLLVSTLLFAAIYKILPDVKIQWHDVWIGAFVTALLFSVGRLALGWYLGRPGTASPYGSAGALVVLLLWVNYASTILFVGAEFTKAYANKLGSKIEPDDNAVAIMPEDRAKQGFSPVQSQGGASQHTKPGTVHQGLLATAKTSPTTDKTSAVDKAAAQRQEFEYMLSVVGGAALVLMWAFRRRKSKDEKTSLS